jgi:serine/threonine protein kinase
MASVDTRDIGGKRYYVQLISTHVDPEGDFATSLYEGWDPKLRRRVALKEMVALKQNQQSKEFLQHACNEARLLAQLGEQPNLPLIYNEVEEDDRVWLEMEFVKGQTLFDCYLGPNAQPPDRGGILAILDIALNICRALQTLHREHIAHRDVTPFNILVGQRGAKLVDVGLAVWPSRRAYEAWEEGEGTRGYRAPEQTSWRERLTIPSPASDVYSLGAVLYHLLTVSPLPPLPPGTLPLLPSQVNEAVPPALDELVMAALAYHPKERPRPGEFFERLRVIRDMLRQAPAPETAAPATVTDPRAQPAIQPLPTYTTEAVAQPVKNIALANGASSLTEQYNESIPKPPDLPDVPPFPRKANVMIPSQAEQTRAKWIVLIILGTCLVACLGLGIVLITLLRIM